MRNEYYQSVITTAIYIAIFASNIYKKAKKLEDNIDQDDSYSVSLQNVNVYDMIKVEMPLIRIFVEINMGIYYFQMVYYVLAYFRVSSSNIKALRTLNLAVFIVATAVAIYGAVQWSDT